VISENDDSLFNQKSGLSKDHTNESLNMLDTSNYKAMGVNRTAKSMFPSKKLNQTTNQNRSNGTTDKKSKSISNSVNTTHKRNIKHNSKLMPQSNAYGSKND